MSSSERTEEEPRLGKRRDGRKTPSPAKELPGRDLGASGTSQEATGSSTAGGACAEELRRQLRAALETNADMEAQLQYRTNLYMKREAQHKKTVEALESQLHAIAGDGYHNKMKAIRELHSDVIEGLDSITGSTNRVLLEQEKDLSRAFRARLQDISKELEAHKNRKGDQSAELQALHSKSLTDLQAAHELALIFDKKNQQLMSENAKLQERLQLRDDDRQALLRESVLCKRENKMLAQKLALASSSPNEGSSPDREREGVGHDRNRGKANTQEVGGDGGKHGHKGHGVLGESQNAAYERELRQREEIQKLKRQLEAERVERLRTQEAENKGRQEISELQQILRQCVEDVKLEISRIRSPPVKRGLPDPSITVYDMTPQDRERVLELLLSQKRVTELLYSKMCPDSLLHEGQNFLEETPPGSPI